MQTFNVATFYDPDTNQGPGDYSATINWGDGQSSAGTLSGAAGEYTVSGDHVYLHPGSFTVGVSVTDPAGATVSSTATASVASATLTATGGLVDGTLAGSATNFTVATFTDANGYDAAGSYTATISWGDGQSGAGVVTGADGVFQVAGVHTYSTDGTYSVGVTVSDADGTTATTTSQVTAGDLYAGVTQTLTVASFTDPSTYYTASSFNTTINWGDGSSSTGGFVTKAGAELHRGGVAHLLRGGRLHGASDGDRPDAERDRRLRRGSGGAPTGAVLRRGGGRGHERGHGLRAAGAVRGPAGLRLLRPVHGDGDLGRRYDLGRQRAELRRHPGGDGQPRLRNDRRLRRADAALQPGGATGGHRRGDAGSRRRPSPMSKAPPSCLATPPTHTSFTFRQCVRALPL